MPFKKGHKSYLTKESKLKISKNNARYWLGKKRPDVSKRNLGNKYNLGKTLSEETKNKISLKNKGHKFYSGGESCWFKKGHKLRLGLHHSEATKEKLSKYIGEKTSNWQGGISKDKKRYKRIRRNLKYNAIGSHTKKEWEELKKQYNYTCPCCGKSEPNIFLTEDHIIPLSKGGRDNIENIQPLCISCNSKKHTKIIKY